LRYDKMMLRAKNSHNTWTFLVAGFGGREALRDRPVALQPDVGDVVNIVPTHCCVVSNMIEQILGVRHALRTPKPIDSTCRSDKNKPLD
jgi:D-serine deaminase-like pyridoxal phosphate-dependent protein